MRLNKVFFWALLLMLFSLLTACGSNETESKQTADGKEIVTFWHSMGGHNLSILEGIIEEYNESQEDVVVEPVYQGSYREGFSKINSVIGTNEVPALMQLNEESTKPMIDLGFITPMHEFIDKDNVDISVFEDQVLGRYEVDGQLYSMPFNPSIAVVYYNKDAFKEAGLDPEQPPQTYSEYDEAAQKLTNDGMYGMNIRNFGWHYEQLVVNQGGYTVNNENGRSGEPTEATLNSEEMITAISWIKDMYDVGILANLGKDGDDVKDAFFAERTAMFVDSSSVAVSIIEDADFDVGIAMYPVADNKNPEGSVIGGASLWVFNDVPEETQEAAWDFVKYLVEPEVQAEWTTKTGYFPVTTEVYETDQYQTYLEEYPEFQTALDQLHLAEVHPVTQGAYIGVYPEIRVIMEDMIERILSGEVSVEDGLNQANEQATDDLVRYQRTEGN